MVFFSGGVTCSELAALRAVGQQLGCTLVFATTEMINGATLIESMMS
jgi:hypothetical protein